MVHVLPCWGGFPSPLYVFPGLQRPGNLVITTTQQGGILMWYINICDTKEPRATATATATGADEQSSGENIWTFADPF